MLRTVILSCSLLLLAACSSDDSADDHLARAQRAIDNAEYPTATIELKNALKLAPDSAQARWLLGNVYHDTGDLASAEKELTRALELGWPGDYIQPVLAEAMLAKGEYKKILEMPVAGLAADAQASLLATQAQAALNLGDTWHAEELIDQALVQKPDSIDASMAKARLQAIKGDLDGATATLDRVLALDPRQAQAWSLRGDLYAEQRDLPAAISAYSKAIDLQRNDFSDLLKRALLHLQLGDNKAAQRDASALLARSKNHPAANYVQGMLQYQAGQFDKAIASLTLAESAYKEYPLSQFFLASANLQQGNMDQAATQAERFHNLMPNAAQGRLLLAAIRLQQGNYASVQALLAPVLAADPDNIDALNLTTNALLREGKTDEGLALLSRVAELQPDSPNAQIRLGAGLLVSGNNEASVEQLETALQLDPEFVLADILLVFNHLQQEDYPAAIEAAKSYQSRHPTEVTPLNLLGRIYQEAGQPEQARSAFERALKLDKSDPAANHHLAQLALADGADIATARGYYDTVLEVYPNSVATLLQLGMLDAREGDEEQLTAHLQRAMEAEPAALRPRLFLARLYLSQGKPEQVAPLFSSLDPQLQEDPDVLQVMAMAQLSNKDPVTAQYTLEQLLKSTPDSAPIRHVMAMAAAAAGDQERAVEELNRALALDENYTLSRIALARIALAQQSTQEFEKQLKILTSLAPENPDVLLLRAVDQQRNGNIDQAIVLAQSAYELTPSTGTLVSLNSYYEAAGKREAALQRYADWLQEYPQDATARLAYANSLQAEQQEGKASEQYAKVLETEPNNLPALNNLAWIIRNKEPEQALEYARKAAALAPESGEVLDTLAVIEYGNKDYRRAQRTIRRALEQMPDNPSVQYHDAMIAVALDDKDGARVTLERLLQGDSEFPERAEAQALAAKISN